MWCIDWTGPRAGIQKMGFPERPTKSAFIARFNNNHFGVLYKKTDDGGFQIVFDGADEQKAQEVARTLGKQYCPPPAQPCEENADDEVCEVHEAEREAEREAKRDAEAQQQKQREEEDAREEMLEQKHNDEAEIKEPDAYSEENHTDCGEPVLFFRAGRVFRLGCEKHMRTWEMGPGTLAHQRAQDLGFHLNDATAEQSVQEALKRWENRTIVEKIQECINEIGMAAPTKAADFEWPKTGKKARYAFDELPKHLWLYSAVIKE